jgi:lipopolysaccharide transport protein LptA
MSLLVPAAVAQLPPASGDPIVIHSVFSNIDDQTNTAEFTSIVVSRGSVQLTAGRARANGLDFQNSQWTFEERVMITLEPRGSLYAEQAKLQFRDGELTQVTAIGSPAHFEQRRTGSHRFERGWADEITYDAKEDSVHLFGHAQLSVGPNVQIHAPAFTYHVRDDSLQADSQSERQSVHITVTP